MFKTKDDVRDVAILITEHLLDNAPEVLHPSVAEVDGEYTTSTFELQDQIFNALLKMDGSRYRGMHQSIRDSFDND